jgi:hypothetical protein
MIQTAKIISSKIDKIGRRLVKFFGLGTKDVKELLVAAPYGVDSNPVKDMVAIYGSTTIKGESVVIGYINKNAVAKVGELRFFSTNSTGAEQIYVYLKDNGKISIGGETNHLTRFENLEIAVGLLETALNAHTHLGNLGYPTGPPVAPFVIDISAAKTNNINIA